MPLASAQQPEMTATFVDPPEALPAKLLSNQTAEVTVSVQITLSNVICSQASSTTVTLSATPGAGAGPWYLVTVDPESQQVAISQGVHGGAQAGTPARGTADFKVKVQTLEIPTNASIPIMVKASASPPANCQGTSAAPGAQSGEHTILSDVEMTYVAPTVEMPPAESPGPGALMGVLAANLAAAFLRRRR